MFGHLPEFFIILVIGLIVFGPERLPEVAANAGKMVREVRQALDVGLNQHDVEVPTDFSTYYYESMARSGEDVPAEVIDAHDYSGFVDSGAHPLHEDGVPVGEPGVETVHRDAENGKV